jgi:hypothetical protein
MLRSTFEKSLIYRDYIILQNILNSSMKIPNFYFSSYTDCLSLSPSLIQLVVFKAKFQNQKLYLGELKVLEEALFWFSTKSRVLCSIYNRLIRIYKVCWVSLRTKLLQKPMWKHKTNYNGVL